MKPEPPSQEHALEMVGITKRFGSTLANDNVDFGVARTEVHALLGQNGAGKTTLMNILVGLETADSGEVRVWGRTRRMPTPAEAIREGIGMVHQHFMLIPRLTVLENIVLGVEPTRQGVIDWRLAEERVARAASQLGFSAPLRDRVGDLRAATLQRVEILKAIYRGARLLVLDEPTAVLTPAETAQLFGLIRKLVATGASVIFISHKLKEVLAIADRITVLRAAKVVATLPVAGASEQTLSELMLGGVSPAPMAPTQARPSDPARQVVLRVTNLRSTAADGRPALEGLDLDVRAHEVLGLVAGAGDGQDELIDVLLGRKRASGRIVLDNEPISGASTRKIRALGVGCIPADRQRTALCLTMSVEDNLLLVAYSRPPFAVGHGLLFRARKVCQWWVGDSIRTFGIQASSPAAAVRLLSGGHQQRVVAARELQDGLRLLLLDQPTRGLDIASVGFLNERIRALSTGGTAVLIVSTDLDEVLAIADRIAVLRRGRVVETMPRAEASAARLATALGGSA